METKEKQLYELVNSLDPDNLSGFGIHPSSFIQEGYDEDNGFRVYHSDGYCFDITKESYHKDNGDIDFTYTYHEGHFDGFKELSIDDAIKIVKTEGVFK